MSSRPTVFPVWATSNPQGIVSPSAAQTQTGWVPNQVPPCEVQNFLQSNIAQWLQYLDQQSVGTVLTNTLDHSMRLVGGGSWSFNLATSTLAWSANAFLGIPTVADAANTIAAGSVVVPSGSLAYVQANVPFTTSATTTAGSAQLTNVAYADNAVIGNSVSGPGIPANATVQAIDATSGTVNISTAATLSSSGVAVTFSGSGNLTVQVATSQALLPGPSTVVIARGTDTSCIVGVGSGQMKVQDGETKYLLEDGYGSVGHFTAGAALAQRSAVYISAGAADSRTAGSAYPADASANFATRANVAGIAITAASSGAMCKVVTSGLVPGFSGLIPGATYYADPSNVGGITTTKPTAVGQMVCAVGLATSATTLLLALTPASTISGNFTVPGTVTGSSIVSGVGFRQQIELGSYANTNTPANTNLRPVFLGYDNGSAAVITHPGRWPAPFSGSVVAIAIIFDASISGFMFGNTIAQIVRPGSGNLRDIAVVPSFNFTQVGDNETSLVAYQTFTKGQYPFNAGQALAAVFSYSVASNLRLRVILTVEMSA